MNVAVIGEGGFSQAIQEMILENKTNKVAGILNDQHIYISFKNNQFFGPIISADKIIKLFKDLKFVVGIENNAIRMHTVKMLNLSNVSYVNLVHKSAVVSSSAKIGFGTVIMANAVIGAHAKIGTHCIIDAGSIVEYESIIDDFVHISPNATITNRVKIGEGNLIQPGAIVATNTCVDEWSYI